MLNTILSACFGKELFVFIVYRYPFTKKTPCLEVFRGLKTAYFLICKSFADVFGKSILVNHHIDGIQTRIGF